MKIVRNIIIALTLLVAVSCETYDDYKVEYTPIAPLAGEWIVTFTDLSVTPNVKSNIFVLSTYNTADNSSTQMWVRCLNHNLLGGTPPTGKFAGKISCNVPALTFSGADVDNYYVRTLTTTKPTDIIPTFTITEGSVVKDGFETITKGKADKISFKMTDSRVNGKTYLVEGFRRTRWLADEGIAQ